MMGALLQAEATERERDILMSVSLSPCSEHALWRGASQTCSLPVNPSKVKVSVTQSCLALCHPVDGSPPGSSVHGMLQAGTLEWCCFFLQRILPTQGSNPGLLHCRQILYCLSYMGSPSENFRFHNSE